MRRLAMMAVAAVSAFGHHSLQGTYLMDQRVTIQGTVVKFLLQNPHSWLSVEAPDEHGDIRNWAVEWNPGGALGAKGIGRDTIKPGDKVIITMSPGKTAAEHRGLLRILQRPSDGFEWGTKPGEEPMEWKWGIQK